MKRVLVRKSAVVSVVLAVLAGISRGDEVPVAVPERVGRVTIYRDAFGIPHIRGKTDADVAFGLAYAHAEDDFQTTQQALIGARGQTAERDGASGLVMDYLVRLFKVREFIDEKYATDLTPELREYVEAYAEGLTYYARLHPEQADGRFLPYTGKDVVAGFVFRQPFFFGLEGDLNRLRRGAYKKQDQKPPRDELDADEFPPTGSNTFAVGPPRSADGKTRLNINSHQPWQGPVSWYEAHLKSDEGLDVIGGLFPGSPFILHGHNRHLGWAFTVNKPDLVDIYRLKINPDNPNEYRLDGEWKTLETVNAMLRVKLLAGLEAPVTRQTQYSVHGPVFKFDHGVYAIRVAGWGEIRAVEQYYRMNRARHFDEWIAAVSKRWIPSLNICYADKDGNIYYVHNGLIPKRQEGYDWKGVLPGDRSDLIWTEYLPFERLPQVKNPRSGFVQNANSTPFEASLDGDNPNPADYTPAMGIDNRRTDRSLRIRELLEADESITHDEFLKYKWDQTVTTQGRMWHRLQPLFTGDPPENLREATAGLRRWDRELRADSQEAALAALVYYQYEAARYYNRPDPAPWDALRSAVSHLQAHFGRIDATLGDVQRLRRGTVDLPIGGGPRVYNCVHSKEDEADGRLVGLAGDSYVLIVAFDSHGVASSQAIHQYGNVNVPDSPHYADQAPLFVERKMRQSLLSDDEIRSNAIRAYYPGQEQSAVQSSGS